MRVARTRSVLLSLLTLGTIVSPYHNFIDALALVDRSTFTMSSYDRGPAALRPWLVSQELLFSYHDLPCGTLTEHI